MHGTQSGWKKLSTTQLPLRCERSNGVPSPSLPTASGAGLAEQRRRRRSCTVVGVARQQHDEQPGHHHGDPERHARSESPARPPAGDSASAVRRPHRSTCSRAGSAHRRLRRRHRRVGSTATGVRRRSVGGDRGRDRVGRRRRGSRECRQQRADRHHSAADPQPEDHRLDEHLGSTASSPPGSAPGSSVR